MMLKVLCSLLPTLLMCPSHLFIASLLTHKFNISQTLVIAFEKVDRIAKTVHGLNKTQISIDTSKIVSMGLLQTVLMHEIGHAVYNRRDYSGDIMDFRVFIDTRGRLFQHVPFYHANLKYNPFAHVNGNGSITPAWF